MYGIVDVTYPLKTLINQLLRHAMVLQIHESHIPKRVVELACYVFLLCLAAFQKSAKIYYRDRRCFICCCHIVVRYLSMEKMMDPS
jgi:hypothetical protein